jgi:CO dehydrogenase/acetyl-CoA synthase beta subunit
LGWREKPPDGEQWRVVVLSAHTLNMSRTRKNRTKDKLPPKLLEKLTTSEQKKLAELEDKRKKLLQNMLLVQGKATDAMRKEMKQGVEQSAATQRLINAGFKAEMLTMQASDKWRAYQEALRTKYT